MSLDTEKILTGTPFKVLLSKYNELKENLTNTAALEYSLLYSSMPLSFILKNSFYIFTEPFRGTKFYQEFFRKYDIPLKMIEEEIVKVQNYYDEKKPKMSLAQQQVFETLLEAMNQKVQANKESILIVGLPIMDEFDYSDNGTLYRLYDLKQNIICSGDGDDSEKHIMDLRDFINEEFRWSLFPDILNVSLPIRELELDLLELLRKLYSNDPDTESSWGQNRSITNILSRMLKDSEFQRRVSSIHSAPLRDMIRTIAGISMEVALESVTVRVGDVEEEVIYSTPENSINRIYANAFADEMLDIDDSEREETLSKEKVIIDTEANFVFNDILTSDDEIHVEESEGRLQTLLGRSSEIHDILVIEFTNDGTQPKTLSKDLDKHSEIQKPPKQGINKKIQTAALDSNVQMRKKVAAGQRKTQELRNTAKAVTQIPETINNNVKGKVKEWDDLDDDKRKEYILEAGFRKKYFKMFKLALTHYIAFAINPLLNIVVFICTKMSAHKDARIRNELITELASEIRICDEKIQDASAKGEKKKKYQLMRIKDKLEAERVRVTANSKYI